MKIREALSDIQMHSNEDRNRGNSGFLPERRVKWLRQKQRKEFGNG